MNPDLFIMPVSEEWEPHFRRTVESQISIPEVNSRVPSEGRLWGMEEGSLNRSTWERMSPGDWIFFYANKEIFAADKIETKFKDDSLGSQIWSNPSSTLLFTLEGFTPVSIPIESMRELLDYKSGYYPQGPKPVRDEKLEILLSQYPSIEACVDHYNISTKSDQDAGEQVPEKTTTTTYQTVQYSRSEKTKEYVKSRADGVCEGCGDPAPFTSKTGDPYLHAHHVHELSDGGSDTPETVIALCPNCHYRVHHGEDGREYNEELIERLADIEEVSVESIR